MVAELGLIKVLNVPQEFCFQGTAAEIVQQLANVLAVELPASITNVWVGPTEPPDTQNWALWVARNNAGTFVGLRVVSDGVWLQVVDPPP